MGESSRSRRRVLHLIDSGGIYGAERVILNLSREMRAARSYEPVIGCIVQRADQPVDLIEFAAQLCVEAHRLVIANWRFPWDLVLAARKVRALGIDLIHCHGYKPTVFASVIGKLTGIPVIATCHLWFVDAAAPLKMRVMIGIEKRLYRRFPAVVAVSESIRKTLLSVGVEPAKVHLVANGVVLDDYGVPAQPRQDGLCVINVARLTAQKAQHDLITAAALIKVQGRRLKVLIVGEGELREELTQMIRREGLEDTVELLGFREDVGDLLRQSDIFVLPSLDEGMPVSLLEAVAAGVPVVTTAVGDIPKLIVNGETGVIVERNDPQGLANAILSLAEDSERRAALASGARRKLSEVYSSKKMYEMYDRVYAQIQPARPGALTSSR